MKPSEINELIRAAGTTQSAIADELKVSVSLVNSVVHGRSVSRRVTLAVCKITTKRESELWPNKRPSISSEEARRTARSLLATVRRAA